MPVNSTYIAAAPDLFARMSRFSSETGYIYGHGLIILIAMIAAYKTSQYGSAASAGYASAWAFLASLFLWAGGWESPSTVIFCGSCVIVVVLFSLLSSD